MSNLIYSLESECEIHITIEGENSSLLNQWMEKNGYKFTFIALNSGDHPNQKMISRTDPIGPVAGTLKWIYSEVIFELKEIGLKVLRVKLEIPPYHEIVPETIMDITQEHSEMYFESHFKILIEKYNIAALEKFSSRYNCHMAKNAFKFRQDGLEERFLTLRSYHSKEEHEPKFNLVKDRLDFYGFNTIEVENEYVIFDSNLGLDKGWSHQ